MRSLVCAKSQVSLLCLVELVLECRSRYQHCRPGEASDIPGKGILSFFLMAWLTGGVQTSASFQVIELDPRH